MSEDTSENLTQKKLIEEINNNKNKDEKWGLLTGNGFNLACGVVTDYQTLCESLIESLDELDAQEKKLFVAILEVMNGILRYGCNKISSQKYYSLSINWV